MKAVFISLFLFFSSFIFAQDVEETFLQANNQYQSNQFEQALDLYSSIERKGPATWCNMGNCAFRMKNYVEALVFWKRAKKGASRSELIDLNKHIAAVDQLLGRAPKAGGLEQYADRILGRFSLFSLQLLFLFAWLSLFGFIFFVRVYKPIFISILLPTSLVFGFATFAKYRLHSNPAAIVIEKSVSLFSGPDQNYPILKKTNLADEVAVLQQRDHWYKVRSDGLAGWMLADKLEVI